MTAAMVPGSEADFRYADLLPVALCMLIGAADGGLDARRQLVPALALSAAAEGKHESLPGVLLAGEVERFLNPSRDEQIDALYGELAALATGPDKNGYQERLAQLRTLQREEAQELSRMHRERRELDPNELRDSIMRAQEILNRHADSSGQNKPT